MLMAEHCRSEQQMMLLADKLNQSNCFYFINIKNSGFSHYFSPQKTTIDIFEKNMDNRIKVMPILSGINK